MVEELLHLLPAEQLGRMRAQYLRQMGSDHGACIDHGVTCCLRRIARIFLDPHRGQTKRGISGGDPGDFVDDPTGINREKHAGMRFVVRDLHSF
jgi:hypothetical protein